MQPENLDYSPSSPMTSILSPHPPLPYPYPPSLLALKNRLEISLTARQAGAHTQATTHPPRGAPSFLCGYRQTSQSARPSSTLPRSKWQRPPYPFTLKTHFPFSFPPYVSYVSIQVLIIKEGILMVHGLVANRCHVSKGIYICV